ncbi:hypothetical protein [Leeuwenhoekiella sp.]|uniref:hypothetical protein n=1 Tax=Leeuwenhoekiella sp. TaxID=1977054 RepID=UPI000C369314|nr:hypothetical protein [Leeuwenhoekiella sp.]MBA80269.1 hypothetical protein [Leeuwenhoekiella sp.]|tara:strand:+ start:128499 stop:129890 length:1392 start_codon:yes stop_codon:yes gene_type:complete
MAASSNSLFTFSFKLILFLSVLGAFIWVFLIPFAPDIDSEQKYVYAINKINKEENENKYDIAFFGNSYAFTAYDPTMIKNKLGLNAIHLNSGAQRLETSLFVAEEVLKKHKLKYAIFEVSGATLLTPSEKEQKIWYFQTMALQETPFSINKFINVTNYFPVKEQTKYYASALSKYLGRTLRLNDIENYKSHIKDTSYFSSDKIYFSYDGFLANNRYPLKKEVFEKDFYREPYKNKKVLWTEKKISIMEKFIRNAQKQGTQVILLHSLKVYPTIYNDSAIQKLLKKYDNVRFLDLNAQRDRYSLNAQSFYNATHLNYRGSYQATNRLVESLSQLYDIPIKNNTGLDFKLFKFSDFFYSLEGSQDKFVKFEFDSIPKVLKNHKLIVSLYPIDPDLLSDRTKKSNYESDNYSFDLSKDVIDVGTSKVFIKKMDTKITYETLKRLMIYFYNPKDTLKLPAQNIYPVK